MPPTKYKDKISFSYPPNTLPEFPTLVQLLDKSKDNLMMANT